METIKLLEQLGLEEKESHIFMLCLKYGELFVSTIARMMNVPRSTVYGYIEKLHQKGFLVAHKKNKGFTYSAIGFHELLGLLEYQKENINKNIKILKENHDKLSIGITQAKNIPQINYYEGIEAVHLIYDKYISSNENYSIFDIDLALKYTGFDLDYFIKVGRQHTGVTKEILKKTDNAIKYTRAVKSDTHMVKFISMDEQNSFQSDTMLYDGKFCHVSFGIDIVAIEINSKILFNAQKLIFESLWNRI